MKEEKFERIVENQTHLEIVKLFLDKLEKMTEEERKTIIKTIWLLNNPMFVASNLTPLTYTKKE